MGVEDHLPALHSLTAWPALDKAAKLVEGRAGAWDGNRYEYLTPAADALEARHPLAATILRRAMIDYALDNTECTDHSRPEGHQPATPGLCGFQRFDQPCMIKRPDDISAPARCRSSMSLPPFGSADARP
jgi:hypothetical protein